MGPGTKSTTFADNANREKIANIVEVCNVSKEEAARVLEACHQDAAVAIDRFLSGVEAGWSEVSTKKKKPPTHNTANGSHSSPSANSPSATGPSVPGGATSGGRGSGGSQQASRPERDRTGGYARHSGQSSHSTDRVDRRANRTGGGGGIGDARLHDRSKDNPYRRTDDRSDSQPYHKNGNRGSANRGDGYRGDNYRSATAPLVHPTAEGLHHPLTSQPANPLSKPSLPAQFQTVSNGSLAGTTAVSMSDTQIASSSASNQPWSVFEAVPESWSSGADIAAGNDQLATGSQTAQTESWNTAVPSVGWQADVPGPGSGSAVELGDSISFVAHNSKSVIATNADPSATTSTAVTPAATASGTTVAGPVVPQVKRSINYAAAAKAGTSHAQPVTPKTAPHAVAVGSTPPVTTNVPTADLHIPSGSMAVAPVVSESSETLGCRDLTNPENSDIASRQSQAGRKVNGQSDAIENAPLIGIGAPLSRHTASSNSNSAIGGDAQIEHKETEPVNGPILETSLEPAVSRPNAWAVRAAAKETKEVEKNTVVQVAHPVVSHVPPINSTAVATSGTVSSGQMVPDSTADRMSLQFGSFSIGNVDWSINEQSTMSNSAVNSSSVVKQPNDCPVPSVPVTAPAPGLAPVPASTVPGSIGVNSASSRTIVSAAATDINPSSSLSLGPSSTLLGLANPSPAMPQLGLGAGSFQPGSYGAPNPYGVMLSYSPAGIPGFEGSADLKAIPPGVPFYDPASLQGLGAGAPGKYGAMPDMNVLGAAGHGSSTKVPGMELDKGSAPITQGGLPDMYIMGYPPQNIGYPHLYGFPPNPYTGAIAPGSVPPPGSNPYAYSAYPGQNGPPGGGKYTNSSQQQGGRGGFGFDESGSAVVTNPGRNSSALGESMYIPMPAYLSGHIPDGMTGNIAMNSSGKSMGHDGAFVNARGNPRGGMQGVGVPGLGQAPNVGVSSQGMSYGGEYSVVNANAHGVGGWNDQSRGFGGNGPREGTGNNSGLPQGSGAGVYNPGAPGGYWPQQGGYY